MNKYYSRPPAFSTFMVIDKKLKNVSILTGVVAITTNRSLLFSFFGKCYCFKFLTG